MAKVTGAEPKKIVAWSYSRWNEYEQCPLRAKLKVIDRMKEPEGPALRRGKAIHTGIENYLSGKATSLPPEVHKKLHRKYAAMRKWKPLVELEIAFDSGWHQVEWFAKEAWCRVKIDAVLPPSYERKKVGVYDHKTGKFRADGKEYDRQLELYALAGLLLHEKAPASETAIFFTDHGVTVEPDKQYTRKDVPELKDRWVDRTKAMLSDTRFDPRPGDHCRWCSFSKAKGGPCQY